MKAIEISEVLNEILFSHKSYKPLTNAQLNLSGKTHYVDDSTLRFFRSRVLDSFEVHEGLFFVIRESVSADWNHSARVHRLVMFDLKGKCVYHPSVSDSFHYPSTAKNEFKRFNDCLNPLAYYREEDRKSTRLNSSHVSESRMPSSA